MNVLDAQTQPLAGRCLIEASAGTGKTHAITSLVLRLLLGHDGARTGVDPLELERILVVTYTRAATEELRGRIRKRIVQARAVFAGEERGSGDGLIDALYAASSDREADFRRLRLAEQSLDLASVFTIHSFAMRMLERNAFDSGASFAAAISEDDKAVVTQVMRDFWRERVYPLAHLGASLLLDAWSVESLERAARGLIGRSELVFDNVPPTWEALLADIAAGERQFLADWAAESARLEPALREAHIKAKGRRACDESLARLADPARTGLDVTILRGLSRARLQAELKLRPRGTLPESTLFAQADALLERGAELGARLLHDAVVETRARLAALKARTARLGYEDLLRLLWEGLAAPGSGERLARAIRAQYPAALVDECQDTDPLQWRVFERIYAGGDGTLFLVGDPKQAIYGFRGADVYAYLGLGREIGQVRSLDTNRRSVRPLVGALNALFTLRADGDPFRAPDMRYREVSPSGAPDQQPLTRAGTPLPPLQLILQPAAEPVSATEYRRYMAERSAAHIAWMLGEAQAGRILIGECALAARDIACLVRSRVDAEPLAAALRRRGVPYVYQGRESVFATPVARDLHRLLAALLEPRAARRVRAALASALLMRDAAELDAMLGDDSVLQGWQDRFTQCREELQRQGVQAALRGLLLELDVPARLLAAPDGERWLTDTLHLLELLGAERAELEDDEALLARLAERITAADGEREEQRLRLESDADRVRIVTLHGSKGLQYPVVLLPFPALRRVERSPFYHAGEALAPHYDLRAGEVALERAEHERLAEDLRLLYVGLTRAVHCCVVGVADVGDVSGKKRTSALAASALGWLIEADRLGPAAAIDRLCALPGVAVVEPLDAHLRPVTPAAVPLAARVFRGTIETGWRSTSFSAITGGASGEQAERVFRQPELLPGAPLARAARERSIFGFGRGAEYGNLLHGLLERAELARAADCEANITLVRAVLARAGLEADWQPVLAGWLDEIRECALDGDALRLAALPPAARVAELGFELPLSRLDSGALNALLLAHEPLAARAPPLAFRALHGMLSGFIDLVFEYQGRYYVADYKSNHLGETLADYAPERLAEAIVEHRYDLQYVLYSVALYRYLRARLGARFHWETHMGGVYYLFLRGMRRAAGNASGVYFTRPSRVLIEALDRMFAEEPA